VRAEGRIRQAGPNVSAIPYVEKRGRSPLNIFLRAEPYFYEKYQQRSQILVLCSPNLKSMPGGAIQQIPNVFHVYHWTKVIGGMEPAAISINQYDTIIIVENTD
jgi:hypothetical protein